MLFMLDSKLFLLFLAAAVVLALTPGPGIFYVLGRTLSGGRREGLLSSAGTFLGGLAHTVAAAIGLSAILAVSAIAFSCVKYAGAIYLVWIGISMIRSRNLELDPAMRPSGPFKVFRQGVLTEILNPKTALFFLSFLPQFASPHLGHVVRQLFILGFASVLLNTLVDVAIVFCSAPLGNLLRSSPRFRRNQRVASGLGMIGLGAYVALGESK
jgi:threonine/homoserine/homoserine lactone efflux protein